MKNKSQENKEIRINKDYLREVIAKNVLKQNQFSLKLGQCESYIWNVFYRGTMRKSTALLLCDLFDADLDKLTYTPEQDKPIKKVMMADDKSIEALANSMIRVEAKLDKILETLM